MSDYLVIKFVDAAINNDIDEIDFCFNMGVDVNCTNENGDSALVAACLKGNTQIVERLLQSKDIDINQKGKLTKSPLFLTCEKGFNALAITLLEHPDVDVNSADKNSTTILMIALRKRNDELLGHLLTHPDIDVNQQKKDGTTALMYAVNLSYVKAVNELLLFPQIDISLTNKRGENAKDIAKKRGNGEIIKCFENSKGILGRKNSKLASKAMDYTLSANRGSFLSSFSNEGTERRSFDDNQHKQQRDKLTMLLRGNTGEGTKKQI